MTALSSKVPSRYERLRRRTLFLTDFSLLLSLLYSALVRRKFRRCGNRLRIHWNAVIKGHENILLGDNFASAGMLYLYAHDGGYLEIGDNCSLNTNVQLGAASGRIVIGDNVMIAPNVVVRAANHGMLKATPMRLQVHSFGEIIIEDDVWIGANAVITAGVRIAAGTVVGAGAVVTKSTEAFSVVGGVPARKIGERI